MSRRTDEECGLKGAAAVAQETKVSVFTISRVFNGAASVSPTTRRRVLEASRRLGYRVEAATQLLTGATRTRVGFIRPARIIQGQIYQEILAGLELELGGHDVSLVLSGDPDQNRFDSWVEQATLSTGCDGVFVLLEEYNEPTLLRLSQLGFPVVLIYHAPVATAELGLSSIGYDTGSGIAQAVRHLAEIGHREIAYFGIPEVLQEHLVRENAFRAAMLKAGLDVREDWIVPYRQERNLPAGAAAFDQVFSQAGERPTAVVCASDAVALGALSGARRWNRAVPADVSITGFDDNFWLDFYTPAVTSVRQSGAQLGAEAARLMMSLLRGEPRRQIVLPTQLIVRESTAPPR